MWMTVPVYPGCQNGDSCSDKVNGFNCSCQPGYNGSRCEIDVDECASSPCQNGGSCSGQVNGFNCSCQPGFNGSSCEIDVDECASGPCKNGGSCSDKVNGFNCSCHPEFSGSQCEIGSCSDKVNGFNCSCQPGYNGSHCEIDVDECVSSPCKNGGSCSDQVNGFNCSCQSGFKGSRCEIACQSPWIAFQGSCYALFTQALTWYNARANCLANGAQLVKIESVAENDFIKNAYMADGLDFWIGLTDEQDEGVWKWSDGSELSGYINWVVGQPSNHPHQNCVGIRTRLARGEDTQWHDKACYTTKGFICKKYYN